MSTARQNQPAPFAIGTSTSVAATPSNVDMSLDDLISNRRKQNRKNPPRAASKTPTASARATGQNKARRGAVVNARRGINTNTSAGGNTNAASKGKPSAMEVERQVYRAQRRAVGGALRAALSSRGGRSNIAARAGGTASRATAPRVSDAKAKAKARLNAARAVIAKQKGGGASSSAITAPTPQAVSAAARAMKDFGFTPPKGMQMQISFVPKMTNAPATAVAGGDKGGRGNRNGNAGGRGRGGGRGRVGRR
ncbi:hypothetical protein ACHAWX_001565 [Stephanocyclus meneghinianus]